MTKRHLKRVTTPKSWPITRKGTIFVTRPSPGAHKLKFGMPLSMIFKDLLKIASTTKEAKSLLLKNDVKINGIRRKDYKFMVGLFDTISLPEGENYRLLLEETGKFMLIKIDVKEALISPFKIMKKTMLNKGQVQFALSSGRTIKLAQKDAQYKVGDSLLLTLPKTDIKEHLKLEKGCMLYMTAGAHIGKMGKLESLDGEKITFSSTGKEKKKFETLKKYGFVVGKTAPSIKLSESPVKE